MSQREFLGYEISEVRHLPRGVVFSRLIGWRAERRTDRSERLEARTLRELKTLIRAVVAARRTGVIR